MESFNEIEVAELLCTIKRSAERTIPERLAGEFLHDGAPASFVVALHTLLLHEPVDLVELTRDGELVVCDSHTLEESGVLGRYYKHNNSKSFQRQLYNFGWVRSTKKNRRSKTAFTHPALEYGNPLETLLKLKRKSPRDIPVAQEVGPPKRRRLNQGGARFQTKDGFFSPTSASPQDNFLLYAH
ncbi:hypothetical protein CTAYLR_003016 [Chrysophaeum taylorii]|uniref:HSF-type DNA-binding domain-containing protein n=1 Tax=Chrysophaeum taylorii TaxID=2483200 RepID=A0AAD7U526_9STRA|nr:hypothetical protein CTAYLR_003016 [Chrysophaeum taylorii]